MEKMIPTRNGFGEGVVEAGRRNKNVVVLCADLTDSTRAGWFKKEFPDRFFPFGVAEQDMCSAAAGMSLTGKIPFACTFGVFASGRAWDQVRISVAYMNLNVKIIGTHGGVSVGEDGATHQAIEEVSLMRILPNMTVLVPCDALEAKKATIAAAEYDGPVYIRLGRNPAPIVTKENDLFIIGKANTLREGNDVTIIASGHTLVESKKAADILSKKGIEARVINLHTPKPIDKDTILKAAKETGAIVTVEEHLEAGGMGSAVAEILCQEYPVPIKMIAIKDRFGESGKPLELLKMLNLMTEDILSATESVLKLKKRG